MPGEDGWGRGGDGTSPTIQETKLCGDSVGDKGIMSRLGPAAPPIPQRGTAADKDSAETLHRHPYGARAKHGALARRKYGLLAPAETAGDPAASETQVSGDGHKATMGTDDENQRERETGDRTGQRTLLARGMPEDSKEARRYPEHQRMLNRCIHRGKEGGAGPLTQQRAPNACSQGPEGYPQTWKLAPLSCGQGTEEEEGPPTQQRAQPVRGQGREGATLNRQHATLSCIPGKEEGGYPPTNISVRNLHTSCRRGRGGGPPDQEGDNGAPPEQCALQAYVMKERDGGVTPRPRM